MKTPSSPKEATLRNIGRLRRKEVHAARSDSSELHQIEAVPPLVNGSEIKVICLYPSVVAGKLAREWFESALHAMAPQASTHIEYFNYDVLGHDGISWEHVLGRMKPDIILMVGDGKHVLGSGLRHSLRNLLSLSNDTEKPMVIFRDLEPEPTINTKVLLDYVSALTRLNHCELTAMNGNGTPISCFGHRQYFLKTRKHHD
jgi:hypothetical protein